MAIDSSRELWNHPLCWSLPSRYISAGHESSGLSLSTAAWLTPESNHTSSISVSFVNSVFPHFGQLVPFGRSSDASFMTHTSAPSLSIISAILLIIFWSITGSLHDLHLTIEIVTSYHLRED